MESADHAQSTAAKTPPPVPATSVESTAAKAAPVIARLEKALATKDKFGAEDVLGEFPQWLISMKPAARNPDNDG